MKKSIFIFFILLSGFNISRSQNNIDTIKTFNFGKLSPAYSMNKVYWQKQYDSKERLVFEGLSYNDCHIGLYKEYYKSGKIKYIFYFKENKTGDWTKLKDRDLCSVPDGVWEVYSEDGELWRREIYKDGNRVIK